MFTAKTPTQVDLMVTEGHYSWKYRTSVYTCVSAHNIYIKVVVIPQSLHLMIYFPKKQKQSQKKSNNNLFIFKFYSRKAWKTLYNKPGNGYNCFSFLM